MDEIKPYREIIYLKDHIETYCNDMAIVTIPNPNGFEIQYGDSLNITIEHKDIGWIRKDDFSASSILSPPYVKDFLIDIFRLFNAKNSLGKYSLKPGTDERKHVTGISWLFTMIGFRTIVLGNVDSNDEKTNRTQAEYSCDILLSDATRIFVVDCTSSAPSGSKITKINNTAKYVKEKIHEESHHDIDVIPVIISSEDCSGLKVDARKSHVTLIDKNDIENLYNLLLDGLKTEAIQYFNALITSFRFHDATMTLKYPTIHVLFYITIIQGSP